MNSTEDNTDTPPFAARYAALLADLKDHRSLGLAVDDTTIARLAQLHGVPAPARDPVDEKLRDAKHEIEVLSTQTALARARADSERQAREASEAQAALQAEAERQARQVAKIQQQTLEKLRNLTGSEWTYDQ